MYSSDTEFFLTLVGGLAWGWMMKSVSIWGKEMERREQENREARQRLRQRTWEDNNG